MTKTKISLLNALSSVIHILMLTVVGLIINRAIITYYGSDYNGINSTVIQIANSLMFLELGFVLASNVALFKPFIDKDTETINGILSATRIRFVYIGGIALFIGIILSFIYPLIVTTSMPKWMVFSLMLTVIIPVAMNLGINMKYKALILTSQREYIISFTSIAFCVIGNAFALALIVGGFNLLVARLPIMIFTLLSYFYIGRICKREFPNVRFNTKPLFDKIKGTRNVIYLNIMSILYSSLPIVVISTFPDGGSMFASVYSVYRMISNLPAYILKSISSAPRLGFGTLFVEGNNAAIKKYFLEYEMIICMALAVILGVTCLMFFPFIRLYTSGVSDISYINVKMALLVLSTIFIEIIHIPSGQMILMKGDFLAARKIQSWGCVVIIIAMAVSRIYLGYMGIVASVLLGALFLFIAEIYYASVKILHRNIGSFLKNILPALAIVVFCAAAGLRFEIAVNSYVMFFIWASLASVAVCALTFAVYFLLKRADVVDTCGKLWSAISSRIIAKKTARF